MTTPDESTFEMPAVCTVGYMLQVRLRQGWMDAFNSPIESYAEVLPLRGESDHMRLIWRTIIDEVLP